MTMPSRYRVTVLALAMVLAAGLLAVVLAKPAWADDHTCVGQATGTFDNVVVPSGARCTLSNSTVKGNVKALENSGLVINNGSKIGGNVEGDKADLVQIRDGTTVHGNVLIKEGGPALVPPAGALLCSGGGPLTPCEVALVNSTIEGGNTQVEQMTGDVAIGDNIFQGTVIGKGNLKAEQNFIPPGNLFQIELNVVAQNLQVFKNTGPGFKQVVNNTVGQELQCFENDPTFVGGPNTEEKAQGQCF